MLIQRNTGAVTRPLDYPAARAAGYAAPSTQADQRATAPSAEVVKATRLAGEQNTAQAATEEIKATRLAQPNATIAYPPGELASPAVAHGAREHASFLSKLNWKHYAAAGAAFLVLIVAVIAGTFALAGGSKSESVPPPAIATPEAPNPSPPAVSSEPAPAPAQSGQPVPTPAAPVVSGSQPPESNSNSSVASPGRVRTPAPKTTETPSVSQQTPPAVQPPPQTQPAAAPPKEEKVVATKPETEKKEPEKKPEVKKRGIFGKLKDAITGGKKEEKKKP
jgi:hypothetical protein